MQRKAFTSPRSAPHRPLRSGITPVSQKTRAASPAKIGSSLSPGTPAPTKPSPRPTAVKTRAPDVPRPQSSLDMRRTAAEELLRPFSAQGMVNTRTASPAKSGCATPRRTPAASPVTCSPRPRSSLDMRRTAAEELPRPSSAQGRVNTRTASPEKRGCATPRRTPAASPVMCSPRPRSSLDMRPAVEELPRPSSAQGWVIAGAASPEKRGRAMPRRTPAASRALRSPPELKAKHGLPPLKLHHFSAGARVHHPRHGAGTVEEINSNDRHNKLYTVKFDNTEVKHYSEGALAKLQVTSSKHTVLSKNPAPSPQTPRSPVSTRTIEQDLCMLGLRALPPQPDHGLLESQSSEACHKHTTFQINRV